MLTPTLMTTIPLWNDAPTGSGVDIGGTKALVGSCVGGELKVWRFETPDMGRDATAEWVRILLEFAGAEVAGPVTLALPGIIRTGEVIACDVVPGLLGWHLDPGRTGVRVINDGKAAMIGAQAVARDEGAALCIAAGTGLAAAWRPEPGGRVYSIEIGHFPVSGRPVRDVAAGAAICKALGCTAVELPVWVAAGDQRATTALDAGGRALGQAVALLANLVSAERCYLVGGLTEAEAYWRAAEQTMGRALNPTLPPCSVIRPEHGSYAALIGAVHGGRTDQRHGP